MHKVYGPLGWDVNLLGSLDFNDNTPILQPVPLHKSKMATSQDDRNDNDVDSIATTEDDFSNSILDDSFLDDNTNLILIPDEKDDDDAVDNNDGDNDEEQDKENDGCQGDDGDGCYGDDGMNSSTTAVKEESTTVSCFFHLLSLFLFFSHRDVLFSELRKMFVATTGFNFLGPGANAYIPESFEFGCSELHARALKRCWSRHLWPPPCVIVM